jgi:hypothetical protein
MDKALAPEALENTLVYAVFCAMKDQEWLVLPDVRLESVPALSVYMYAPRDSEPTWLT